MFAFECRIAFGWHLSEIVVDEIGGIRLVGVDVFYVFFTVWLVAETLCWLLVWFELPVIVEGELFVYAYCSESNEVRLE